MESLRNMQIGLRHYEESLPNLEQSSLAPFECMNGILLYRFATAELPSDVEQRLQPYHRELMDCFSVFEKYWSSGDVEGMKTATDSIDEIIHQVSLSIDALLASYKP